MAFSYCQPIKDEQAYNEQNWQNPMVVDRLGELDPEGLVGVAPFFQVIIRMHEKYQPPS